MLIWTVSLLGFLDLMPGIANGKGHPPPPPLPSITSLKISYFFVLIFFIIVLIIQLNWLSHEKFTEYIFLIQEICKLIALCICAFAKKICGINLTYVKLSMMIYFEVLIQASNRKTELRFMVSDSRGIRPPQPGSIKYDKKKKFLYFFLSQNIWMHSL